MTNVNQVIEQIRIANPKRDRSSITNFKGMHDFLKFVDLPDNFADLLRHLWPVIKNKTADVMRLSYPCNSKETYHELIVGYSLNDFCVKNSLELAYSPNIQNQTPDWVINDGVNKAVIEICTINKSDYDSVSEACISLIRILIERYLRDSGIVDPFCLYATGREFPLFRDEVKFGKYTDLCYHVANRMFIQLTREFNKKAVVNDDIGLCAKLGSPPDEQLTTHGYETHRVIDAILDKGKNYSDLSKEIPVIVAVANSHQNRSKAYSPSEVAKLLYYPVTVYEPQFSRITDKAQHIKNIQDRIENLNVLEGILFYYINVSNIYTTCYEYYPNPHKTTKWEIPDRFKSYLEGSSNECKQ